MSTKVHWDWIGSAKAKKEGRKPDDRIFWSTKPSECRGYVGFRHSVRMTEAIDAVTCERCNRRLKQRK